MSAVYGIIQLQKIDFIIKQHHEDGVNIFLFTIGITGFPSSLKNFIMGTRAYDFRKF